MDRCKNCTHFNACNNIIKRYGDWPDGLNPEGCSCSNYDEHKSIVHILHIEDGKYSNQQIKCFVESIINTVGGTVIVLPKTFSLDMNVSEQQLIAIRDYIDKIVKELHTDETV